MKKLLLSLAFAMAVTGVCHAQEDVQESFSNHQVAMGETVLVIAKKYKITPRDIYDYNPDAIEGISPNSNIRVPLHRQVKPKPAYVEAKPKALPKKEIEEQAPIAVITEEEQTQEVIVETETVPEDVATPASAQKHIVESGETLSGLARKYNTTVEAITESNLALLKRGLQTGQQLTILTDTTVATAEINESMPATNAVAHTVKRGETLIALARKYNTTVEDITVSNQSKLQSGLKAGQVLTIKNNTTAISTVAE